MFKSGFFLFRKRGKIEKKLSLDEQKRLEPDVAKELADEWVREQ